ncbi:hypothetical protein LTR05_008585 [Lithohypha guttulata]|uniref:Uncharacterized protein n=1 Tax=Lithohypha guttulata TaxID=1690604 RepID=A0AAN7SLC6_9EURO|nr:hypothetical protein LTR05_008585 [Lithohypha guttulata]
MDGGCKAYDDYFDRVLRPPQIQKFDNHIEEAQGSTFALEYQPKTLRASKFRRRLNHEQRLVELVRENSSYRRELRFFRVVFEAMEEMQRQVSSTAQQLVLNHYLDTVQPDDRWLIVADELNTMVQRYGAIVDYAAKDWVEVTEQQHSAQAANKI